MKIAKLDSWVMLFQEYDITFVHIRGKDNILADTVSRLHTIDVYENALENKHHHSLGTQDETLASHKTKQKQQLDSATPPLLLNMNTTTLQNLQQQDQFCKNKVRELHTNVNDVFYLNTDGILKQKVIINNLEVNATVVPSALTYTLKHEFHNCRGH